MMKKLINQIKTIMGKVIKLKNDKNYHWYEIRYVYTIKGCKKFDFVTQVGVTDKKSVLNRRDLKKVIVPLHKTPGVKKMLHNGNLDIVILCYLGYFSK